MFLFVAAVPLFLTDSVGSTSSLSTIALKEVDRVPGIAKRIVRGTCAEADQLTTRAAPAIER